MPCIDAMPDLVPDPEAGPSCDTLLEEYNIEKEWYEKDLLHTLIDLKNYSQEPNQHYELKN